MKPILFVLICLLMASCATSFHADMLKASELPEVPELPALHVDTHPDIRITHDAVLFGGRRADRVKRKLSILLENEMRELMPNEGVAGSMSPQIEVDYTYAGVGWTVASGMSAMMLNLVGMPFMSWNVEASTHLKIRDTAGKVIWERHYFESEKINMGLYYNYPTSEHLEGVALELVHRMLAQARTDLTTDRAKLMSAFSPINTLPPAKTEEAAEDEGEVLFSKTSSEHDIRVIAVIPKAGKSCSGSSKNSDDLSVYAESALLGTYQVVDRQFIEDTLQEIQLGMSGITFESGVLEAGCLANAQAYLFVEYGCLAGEEVIKAKLIHCESSEIMWSCVSMNTSAKATFKKVAEELQN